MISYSGIRRAVSDGNLSEVSNGPLQSVTTKQPKQGKPQEPPIYRFVTKQQACAVLQISEATILRWSKEDGFPSHNEGGRWRIWLPDLLAWFAGRKAK